MITASSLITLEEYFMGRDGIWPPTDEMRKNAVETVEKANRLLKEFGQMRRVDSGYRPPEVNAMTVGASKHSKHMSCQAIDLEDAFNTLRPWCVKNLHVLDEIGLWMEDPRYTPTWLHVQVVPPGSGNRIFIP